MFNCKKKKNYLTIYRCDWFIINTSIEYLQGVYISSGYDSTLFNDNNLPKVYFYGKYKYVGEIKNKNNKLVGCKAAELSFVRNGNRLNELTLTFSNS